jgi:hypothetical protein
LEEEENKNVPDTVKTTNAKAEGLLKDQDENDEVV